MINKMISGKLSSVKVWKMLVIMVIFSFSIAMTGCSSEEEGPMEKAGEKMDEAVEETGDKLEDAGDKIKDGMEEAGDKMKEAAEETGEMMEEAGDKMQEAADN